MNRRTFLSSLTLLGVTRKARPPIDGGIVNDSHVFGHRLRDGVLAQSPRETRRVAVAIVGGGIAGLSAAWRLQKRGLQDVVVLEMEPDAGGNARAGRNDVSAYPWAAHYVPVPGPNATLVRELFEELGVLRDGEWDERHLCHAPQERLFIHGRWQEGLEPAVGPTRRDRDQMARFDERVRTLRATGEFTIPMAAGVRPSALDGLSVARLAEPRGARLAVAPVDGRLCVPRRLRCARGRHIRLGGPPLLRVARARPTGSAHVARGQRVDHHAPVGAAAVHGRDREHRLARRARRFALARTTPQVAWIADAVIFAVPLFVAARLIEGLVRPTDIAYSPWITANLTLDRWPAERGRRRRGTT